MAEPKPYPQILSERPSAVATLHTIFGTETPTYQERAFVSDPNAPDDTWGRTGYRFARYDVYWGMYEGTAFRTIQQYAKRLKDRHDLYDAIQAKRAPTKRIVDFATSKQYGGPLDLDAGDGVKVPSAIPIKTEHEYLRPLIGQIWRNSLWATKKNIYPRFGHAMGDVFLEAVDQPPEYDDAGNVVRDGKVYMRVVNPRTIVSVSKDEKDNLIGYVRSEKVADPKAPTTDGTVTAWCNRIEVCYQDPDDRQTIWYQTFKDNTNGERFDWHTGLSETEAAEKGIPFGGVWSQPYGFVPMRHIQNIDVGKGWGWSDYQGDVDKLLGVDDLASKADDQIRKIVDAWFFVDTPDSSMVKIGSSEDDDRDSTGLLFGPVGTTLQPMVNTVDIGDLDTYLKTNDSTIEKSFPVLATEDVSPDASGEARKVAREKVEAETKEIRANYDGPLVDLHKMCISIMIQKQYPGPDGNPIDLGEDAYHTGKLDHSIADRPVFAKSEEDKLAKAKSQVDIVKTATDAGMPLEFACILAEIPDDMVKKIVAAKEKQDAEQVKADRQLQRERLSSTVEEDGQ